MIRGVLCIISDSSARSGHVVVWFMNAGCRVMLFRAILGEFTLQGKCKQFYNPCCISSCGITKVRDRFSKLCTTRSVKDNIPLCYFTVPPCKGKSMIPTLTLQRKLFFVCLGNCSHKHVVFTVLILLLMHFLQLVSCKT